MKSQTISEEDIHAVVEALRGDYLTTGPKVTEFEQAFADFVGAREAVAVCNGTAALHLAMHAAGIGPGDEVILPAITFAATANAVVYQQGAPVFADVNVESLLLDPEQVARLISPRTKAVVAVDYAGQPCDYDLLSELCQTCGVALLADACHAVGGRYKNRPVGSLAKLSTFSFHAVKNMTTGEGGAVTTDDPELAKRMRIFRNHGITSDHHQRQANEAWFYQMAELGFNYRITDIQCALGLAQLKRLPLWIRRRQEVARRYDSRFKDHDRIQPLTVSSEVSHAYHLYVVRLNLKKAKMTRREVFRKMRRHGVGVNVHYIPVYLHPFYRKKFGTDLGLCPDAEAAYETIISLPIHPNLNDEEVDNIAATLIELVNE